MKTTFKPRPILLSVGLFFSGAILSVTTLSAAEQETVELPEV